MGAEGIIAIIAAIGGLSGIIAIIKAITEPFSGKSDEKVKQLIKEVIQEHDNEKEKKTDEKIMSVKDDIIKEMEEHFKTINENDTTILRHEITSLYFKYKDGKKIPNYEKQNWLKMYERYRALGGNSYIVEITGKMKDWEEE